MRSEIKRMKFKFRMKWANSVSDLKVSCVPENLFIFSTAPVGLIKNCLPKQAYA